MGGPHDKIIAEAAKRVLQPLGFERKDRSRTWLADRDWWLAVVEFQPSSWSKGSYLNVAAHWLWMGTGHLSFDFGGRTEGFEEYLSDVLFGSAAEKLAMAAALAAKRLAETFTSMDATADVLLAHDASLPSRSRGSWSTYSAGVAAGLAHRAADADGMFRSISDDRVRPDAERLLNVLSDDVSFRREVASLVGRQRKALGLQQLGAPVF
jgi:hypothetical protein